jgi:hypothetical protein
MNKHIDGRCGVASQIDWTPNCVKTESNAFRQNRIIIAAND